MNLYVQRKVNLNSVFSAIYVGGGGGGGGDGVCIDS